MSNFAYQVFCQIHESRGMAYLNRCKARSFSLNIFQANLKELQECCKLIETPEIGLRLMSMEHHADGVQAHRESLRLLHNFLAAAKSLIDHTRVFVKDNYNSTSIESAYKKQVASAFVSDKLTSFVHDLRNYILHKELPGCQMSIEVKPTGPNGERTIESTVSLKKPDLSTWSRWSQLSLEYLEDAPNEIKLSDLAESYGQKILSFYEWFDSALDDFHANDLSELSELQLRHAEIEASQRET